MSEDEPFRSTIRESVTEIVVAHLARNDLSVAEVTGLVRALFETFREFEGGGKAVGSAVSDVAQEAAMAVVAEEGGGESEATEPIPAVPIDQSVGDDFIICLEDGRRLRMLTRYIKRQYGLEPDEYRRKWNLPDDYPMSAVSITAQRSASAKEKGLGRIGTKKRRDAKRAG